MQEGGIHTASADKDVDVADMDPEVYLRMLRGGGGIVWVWIRGIVQTPMIFYRALPQNRGAQVRGMVRRKRSRMLTSGGVGLRIQIGSDFIKRLRRQGGMRSGV